MSGGVDSSVALLLSREMFSGDSVVGLTLTLSADASDPLDRQNVRDAAAVCASQNTAHISHRAYDEFKAAVIDYFTEEYFRGGTPNPCVVCNREIKFGLLADFADKNGYDKIITGHYARLVEDGGYVWLKKAADPTKDQSYVLSLLSQKQLRRAVFPLGELTKAEARQLADKHGLVNAHRRDSQDICFIPDGDYVGFIARHTGISPIPGNYVNEAGDILGQHKGQWCYTIGQRKGLGISLGKHAFVLSKDAATNTVVLGDEEGLFRKTVELSQLNFPSDPKIFDSDARCTAKLRYAHRESAAIFHRTSETGGILEFDEPQRAPSPGQFAVMYRDDTVIAAGTIVK